jgi:2-polyprenyl-6-hydroxyphenyl methylase/3-demethylubiquinone-9 3-methyltransferase
MNLFDKFLPDEGAILDLGCGYGVYANYLALKSESRQVLGIDSHSSRIQEAKKTTKNRENIHFEMQDIKRAELVSCNGILMTDFLHHLPFKAQDEILKQAYSILSLQGVCVIGEVDSDYKPFWKYWISYLSDVVLYSFSDKLYFRSSSEMHAILSDIGFIIERIPLKKSVGAGVIYICYKKEV